MSLKQSIESLEFFSELGLDDIDKLCSISSLHSYKQDYTLYYESQKQNSLLFLVRGMLKAYKYDKHSNEIFLYYIYKNSLISDISTIASKELTAYASVCVVEDAQILSINYALFKKEFLDNNLLCSNFTQELQLKLQKLESLINREFIFDSVEKVSQMLLDDIEMFNKIKRQEISLMLHIQPATLSRVLNRLKRNKIINIDRGEVIVLDKIALKEVSNA